MSWQLVKPVNPCPICRSKSLEVTMFLLPRTKRYFISCMKCHYCGKQSRAMRIAIAKWNRLMGGRMFKWRVNADAA